MEKYLKQAIEEYEKNIECGKNFYMDASILMDIEEYYEKEGKRYEAEQLMRYAEKLHPDSEEVLVVKGYRARAMGKWNEGLNIIRNIGNQQNRDVQLFYAEWDVACGRLDKAEQRVNDCLPATMQNDDYDWFLDMGEMLLDYGYQQRALKYLLKIPNNYTLRSRVDELIADAYFQTQRYNESIEAANRLVDANPYDANSWTQLADIQQKCKKYVECVQSCDYALAIDENNQRAMSLKVFATFAIPDYAKGLKLCLEYMRKVPNDYSIRMYAGEQLYATKKYEEAEIPLQDALRLCPIEHPDHVRIVNDLCYLYIQRQDYARAEETMLTLCMLGNSLSTLYTQLGNIVFEFKKNSAAINFYHQAVNSPTIEDTEVLTIVQQLMSNDCYDDAERLWYDIAKLPISQSHPLISAYLAYVMFKMNNKSKFKEFFTQALVLAPEMVKQLFAGVFNTNNLDDIVNLANKYIHE